MLSSSAKADDPVNAGVAILMNVTEYWMPRRSLSSGGARADPLAGHDGLDGMGLEISAYFAGSSTET